MSKDRFTPEAAASCNRADLLPRMPAPEFVCLADREVVVEGRVCFAARILIGLAHQDQSPRTESPPRRAVVKGGLCRPVPLFGTGTWRPLMRLVVAEMGRSPCPSRLMRGGEEPFRSGGVAVIARRRTVLEEGPGGGGRAGDGRMAVVGGTGTTRVSSQGHRIFAEG